MYSNTSLTFNEKLGLILYDPDSLQEQLGIIVRASGNLEVLCIKYRCEARVVTLSP